MTNMIGVAAESILARTCERRLGRIVHAAGAFDLQLLSSPVGRLEPRKPLSVAVALTELDLWLLEVRSRMTGFDIGPALCRWPRHDLVAVCRHRWWAWPDVWKAELSWPESALYLEGTLIGGEDAERLMGLLAVDAFERELKRSPPARG